MFSIAVTGFLLVGEPRRACDLAELVCLVEVLGEIEAGADQGAARTPSPSIVGMRVGILSIPVDGEATLNPAAPLRM